MRFDYNMWIFGNCSGHQCEIECKTRRVKENEPEMEGEEIEREQKNY